MKEQKQEPTKFRSKKNEIFARQAVREWMRYWGKYDKPFEFNIAVTELNSKKETEK